MYRCVWSFRRNWEKMASIMRSSRLCFRFGKEIESLSPGGLIKTSEIRRTSRNFSEGDAGINESLLYEDHIPTSPLQKCILTVGSAAIAIMNPMRDDMVAVFGETSGVVALRKMRDKMRQNPDGRAILRERPRINSQTLDFNYLQSLPENTLAAAYLGFLRNNKVSPDTRRPVHFVDDEELAYVIQRYRETHDLVHAILDMPTNMLGEVAVKWVEGIQTGLPMCVLGGLFGAVRLSKKQRQLYVNSYLPWAIQCGYQSEFLMNVYFERHWEEPLDSLKKRLNIPTLNVQP